MEFFYILPQLILLVMCCVILLCDAYCKQHELRLTYGLSQATLVVAAVFSFMLYHHTSSTAFHGNFVRDKLTCVAEIFIFVAMFITLLLSRRYIKTRVNMGRGEYYILALFSTLGMTILAGGHTMLVIYLGLELMSLPLYALVAINRDNANATEAAMKYFVMGAIASAMLLYGMSMVYGATGSLDITYIKNHIASMNHAHSLVLIYGMVFILVAIAFKLAAAPFHMWAPDVYQGAPLSVTMMVGSAPKIAAFAMTIRLLVDMLPGLHVQWQPLLIFLCLVSIGIGNLLAIAQTNIKRLFAYSGIAHMGYMLLGVLAASNEGYSAALFYAITYALTSTAGLSLLVLMSRQGFECENMDDLKGLHYRNPWLALMMLFIIFSMAGVPPFIGFFAKVAVIKALLASHFVTVPIIAIVFAIVGLFYYLRVVKVMYFDKAETDTSIVWHMDTRLMLSINSIALLFFGVFPGALFVLCHNVFA